MCLYRYMRAGQEFIEFPIEDLGLHLARVTRPLERSDKRRILRVPMVLRHGSRVLVQDMRRTLASNNSGASRNACLNFPYLTFTPEQITAAELNFTSLVASGLFMQKGILQATETERQKAQRSVKPLLVYKDYPIIRKGEDTTITVIPASIQFSTKKPEPAVLRDFRIVHGETQWTSIDDAVRLMTEQSEREPDNNIAFDASAIINLSSVRVFNVPSKAGA